MPSMVIRASIVCILALASAMTSLAQVHVPGNDSIAEADLRADLFFLASDAMQGRLTDTPENAIAAEFIKARFERLGLKAMGPNDSYYHPYNVVRFSLEAENRLAVSSEEGNLLKPRLGQDFYPQRFSATGTARGSVVFLGFGIQAPHFDHDDYRNATLDGKIALVLDHEPGEKDPDSVFDGLVTSESSRAMRKALYAQRAGASAILFVSDTHNHPEVENFSTNFRNYWPEAPRRIPRYSLAGWVERVRIPAAQISRSTAEVLLRGSGRNLVELSESAEATGSFSPVELSNVQLEISTDVGRHAVSDRNVVAALEGSDPQLKNEWIVIGAHYDHDGADGRRVFNGADDDGSGTVALLEIAEAYALAARNGQRPRRSVLFAAWNSEERGLLGAWAYAENPLRPLEQTVATLNMDMIGRNEEVPVGGGRRFRGLDVQTAESNDNSVNIMGYTYSGDLKAALERANREVELELKMTYDNNASNLLRRSDQWPFLQLGVPSLFFHTGLHPDYHTEFDVPEKINYAKMARIARLVHRLSWELANSDTRPGYDRKKPVF